MFDFAKDAGQALRNAIGGGKDDVSAQELAETLRAKGVARVNDQIQVKSGESVQQVGQASRFYQVKSGDTLSKIAKEVYGDASQYPQIFEANRPMLKDPDEIYPGQVLRIPQH